jgi:hypothetical protein
MRCEQTGSNRKRFGGPVVETFLDQLSNAYNIPALPGEIMVLFWPVKASTIREVRDTLLVGPGGFALDAGPLANTRGR